MKSFSDSTVVISGGSSGLGRALAEALIAQGARVGIIGTDSAKLETTAKAIRAMGGTVETAQFNVSEEKAWAPGIEALEAALGPIDSLILNAGVGTGSTMIEDVTDSIWRWLWEVNVMGTVYGLRACLPAIKRRGRAGHILITSSIAAVAAIPGLAPYAVTKSALVCLAQTLQAELTGTPIGVSVLIPAAVRTEFNETSARLAPTDFRDAQAAQVFSDIGEVLRQGIAPEDVARFVLERIGEGAFYIFTHPDFRDKIAANQQMMLSAVPVEKPLHVNASDTK